MSRALSRLDAMFDRRRDRREYAREERRPIAESTPALDAVPDAALTAEDRRALADSARAAGKPLRAAAILAAVLTPKSAYATQGEDDAA